MNKIIVAVDDTKGSLQVVETLKNLLGGCSDCSCMPDTIFLLYVQRLEGRSVMDGLLLSSSETENHSFRSDSNCFIPEAVRR